MNLKYLTILIILLLVIWIILVMNVTGTPTGTIVSPTHANNSYWNQSWEYINITSDENLTAANVTFWNWSAMDYTNLSMTNTSGDDPPWLQWYVNITPLVDTPAGKWTNYTITMENTTTGEASTTRNQGPYNIFIDTGTPEVQMMPINVAPGGHTIINGTGEDRHNIALLTMNITDNSTQACIFRVWYETLNITDTYPNFPNSYWTLSTINFTGTLGGSSTDQERNCTYNLTGTELSEILTNGVVIIEGWANDSVGKSSLSTTNLTLVFNTLPAAKWSLLGNTESSTDLGVFANKGSSGNISYVSIFNNTWDNKSYITYRYGYSANADESMDTSNFGAAFVYSPYGWKLIRSNTTLGGSVTMFGANIMINETTTNSSGSLDYNLTYKPVSGVSAFNSTGKLSGLIVNDSTNGYLTLVNSSNGNITFNYEWTTARTPWNLIGAITTNTTKSFANQSANITYVSYYNSTLGYYYTYKKGFNFNENITINRGEAMWILTNINSTTDTIFVNNTAAVAPTNVTWSR